MAHVASMPSKHLNSINNLLFAISVCLPAIQHRLSCETITCLHALYIIMYTIIVSLLRDSLIVDSLQDHVKPLYPFDLCCVKY